MTDYCDTLVIRYIGTRPFRQMAHDEPIYPGQLIDDTHQYAPIREDLLARADFEKVEQEDG